MNNRKGFILYIVIAILLGLAILAFALNDFKRGAVTQLAHNVDQNRLILLCKSANSEALALIRTNANNSPKSNIFKAFRKIFPDFEAGKAQINEKIPVLTNFKPDKTIEIAKESGYSIDIECNVELTSFSKAEYKSVSAFNAYLDIKSKAYRREFPDNSIEVYERHDVRLVDVRHTLDKYVLFVKNYSPDLNNTQRRVIISGMQPPGGGYISRVYLGNDNYPDGKDPEKRESF